MPTVLRLLAAVACALAALGPARAQDTVYVVQRDTVVLIQRDTLFVVERPAPTTPAPASAPGRDSVPAQPRRSPYDIPIEELTDDDIRRMPRGRGRVNARRELLKYRRAMRTGRTYWPSKNYSTSRMSFEPPDPVRTSRHAWAYHYYPTRLLDLDFPALTFGASYVGDGVRGLTATVGILTDPGWLLDDGIDFGARPVDRFGEPRLGIRGFDLGLEARWLLSETYDREPVYLAIGGSFALAPVSVTTLVRNEAGTFSRLAEADVNGRRIEGTLAIGWDGRFRNGFALDLALGGDIGAKGAFSNAPGVFTNWDRWETTPGQWNWYIAPVMRLGIGLGRW